MWHGILGELTGDREHYWQETTLFLKFDMWQFWGSFYAVACSFIHTDIYGGQLAHTFILIFVLLSPDLFIYSVCFFVCVFPGGGHIQGEMCTYPPPPNTHTPSPKTCICSCYSHLRQIRAIYIRDYVMTCDRSPGRGCGRDAEGREAGSRGCTIAQSSILNDAL